MEDREYMQMALALAEKGRGRTAPNPMVGAVIVKEGNIIGQGWHEKYGGAHAESNALASCREAPAGATLYVTLEPCCHYGQQPPCTHAILEAGIPPGCGRLHRSESSGGREGPSDFKRTRRYGNGKYPAGGMRSSERGVFFTISRRSGLLWL